MCMTQSKGCGPSTLPRYQRGGRTGPAITMSGHAPCPMVDLRITVEADARG
jgi:hypothetical protein